MQIIIPIYIYNLHCRRLILRRKFLPECLLSCAYNTPEHNNNATPQHALTTYLANLETQFSPIHTSLPPNPPLNACRAVCAFDQSNRASYSSLASCRKRALWQNTTKYNAYEIWTCSPWNETKTLQLFRFESRVLPMPPSHPAVADHRSQVDEQAGRHFNNMPSFTSLLLLVLILYSVPAHHWIMMVQRTSKTRRSRCAACPAPKANPLNNSTYSWLM